jgi:hypothetical protein
MLAYKKAQICIGLTFLLSFTNKQELLSFFSNKITISDCPDGKEIDVLSDNVVVGVVFFGQNVIMR